MRIIEFPPEGEEIQKAVRRPMQQLNSNRWVMKRLLPPPGGAPHPLMHRTKTIDYGIVLEGEITMVLDRAETTINTGDIVIQRGTNHAWANRSGNICRMAFVLIDGQFANELLKA